MTTLQADDHHTARERQRAARAEDHFTCRMLSLPRLCPRAACRKGDRCHGNPRRCVGTLGAEVPPEVLDWIDLLRGERGSEPQAHLDLAAAYPDEALAWRSWTAALISAHGRR